MTHDFPTLEEVVVMHAQLIREFGGAAGLRDAGALESALMRPQLGYYEGLIQEAAALMESLAVNHPFVDGNKRAAFAATDVFLRLNGRFIDCGGAEAHAFIMRLFATGSFRFAELHEWLEENVKSLPFTK